MSNHYSYFCVDCSNELKQPVSLTPANLNGGEQGMCSVLRYKKQIAALESLSREPGVWDFFVNITSGHWAPCDFFVEHLDCHVVVMSEYLDHHYEPDGTRFELKREAK